MDYILCTKQQFKRYRCSGEEIKEYFYQTNDWKRGEKLDPEKVAVDRLIPGGFFFMGDEHAVKISHITPNNKGEVFVMIDKFIDCEDADTATSLKDAEKMRDKNIRVNKARLEANEQLRPLSEELENYHRNIKSWQFWKIPIYKKMEQEYNEAWQELCYSLKEDSESE